MPRAPKATAIDTVPSDSPVDAEGGALDPGEAPKAAAKPAKKATAKSAAPAAGAKGPKATPRASSLTSMATLEDSAEYINALWYGREGTGKTTDVMTAANHGKIVVVNAEGGLKKKPLRDFGIDLTNIVPWPPTGTELSFNALEDLAWEIASELAENPAAYFAIVWDSGSEIYDMLVAAERVKQFEKNENLRGTAKFKDYREDPTFTDISDYGVVTTQFKILMRRFRDLPCHFLITALERRDVDEDTSKVMYGPAVGPSAQTAMLGLVDLVIYTKAGALLTGTDPEVDLADEFVGLNRTDGVLRAKDRFRAVPRNLVNPTFDRFLAYVDESLIESDDAVQAKWVKDRAASAEFAEERKAARKAAAKGRG